MYNYHKILLKWWPGIHHGHGRYGVQGFERNDLSGELRKATVYCALKIKGKKKKNMQDLTVQSLGRYVWSLGWKRSWGPTSLVPRSELTGVMMCTGWIRRSFHSWLRMSVRSRIFCLLELNMLCRSEEKKKKKRRNRLRLSLPTFSSPSTLTINVENSTITLMMNKKAFWRSAWSPFTPRVTTQFAHFTVTHVYWLFSSC